MPITTTDVYVRPEDGWVEVAENPVSLLIKPEGFQAWFLAVTDGSDPADGLIGVQMGRGGDNLRESFQTGEITGKVFLRVRDAPASTPSAQLRFGVVKDVA